MKKLVVQALKFFGISGIGWLMDVLIFTILTKLNLDVIISNIISSGVAVTFVYFSSTRKLFSNKEKSLSIKQKYLLYIVYQVIMILLSSYVISLITVPVLKVSVNIIKNNAKLVSKILVTPFTMIINFIFMKILVEKLNFNYDSYKIKNRLKNSFKKNRIKLLIAFCLTIIHYIIFYLL